MYKTDVSDYNTLKNQRDYSKILKKYESMKLKTEPTELQKYYQYLTYQQPILDELNYVSERMKNEDIRTKTNDFNFIEDLRKKREELMKVNSKKEEDAGIATLFEPEIRMEEPDMTPTIITDLELAYIDPEPKTEIKLIEKASGLFGDEDEGIYGPEFPIVDENEPLTEEEKEGRRKNIKAREAAQKIGVALLGKLKRDKFVEAVAPTTKAATTIQNAIRVKKAIDKTSTIAAAKEIERIKADMDDEEISAAATTEVVGEKPESKRGRKKGSKNKPKTDIKTDEEIEASKEITEARKKFEEAINRQKAIEEKRKELKEEAKEAKTAKAAKKRKMGGKTGGKKGGKKK